MVVPHCEYTKTTEINTKRVKFIISELYLNREKKVDKEFTAEKQSIIQIGAWGRAVF